MKLKEKVDILKPCEYCGKWQDGSYGSGRFCNKICACGFSSKAKRKEINEKVSKKLMGHHNNKGQIPWNNGLTKYIDKRLKDIGEKESKTKKKKYKNGELKIWCDGLTKEMDKRVMKKAIAQKGKHFSEEHIKNILKKRYDKPSSYEQKIIDLSVKYKLPIKYIGNGGKKIGYGTPDFEDTLGLGLYIETYAEFWKIPRYKSGEKYEERRPRELFINNNKILFLNDKDLKRKDWKQHCLDKINSFIGDNKNLSGQMGGFFDLI